MRSDVRAVLTDFFLDNSFDPTLQNRLSGAQALAYLIAFTQPDNDFFEAAKKLLGKGCDPCIKFLLLTDEYEPESACDRALAHLLDAWIPDSDFLSAVGFSAVTKDSQTFDRKPGFESPQHGFAKHFAIKRQGIAFMHLGHQPIVPIGRPGLRNR